MAMGYQAYCTPGGAKHKMVYLCVCGQWGRVRANCCRATPGDSSDKMWVLIENYENLQNWLTPRTGRDKMAISDRLFHFFFFLHALVAAADIEGADNNAVSK
jgi:hypothetical protein